jgi:uncharacterized protein
MNGIRWQICGWRALCGASADAAVQRPPKLRHFSKSYRARDFFVTNITRISHVNQSKCDQRLSDVGSLSGQCGLRLEFIAAPPRGQHLMLAEMLPGKPSEVFHDTSASRGLLCGKSLIADPTGAVFWPAENALIVADLRLSRCSYLQDEDVVLPPYDQASAFEKLEEALDRYDPGTVIALGNSFAGCGSEGLNPHQTDWLQDMMEGRAWYWVVPQDGAAPPESVGGSTVPHLMLGGIKFRAEAVRAPVANEIAGGLHPIAQVSHYGHLIRGRCFVTNGMRMVLPSIGDYSIGTNVLSSDFDPLLGKGGLFVWFIGQGRVTPVASPQLIEDRAA